MSAAPPEALLIRGIRAGDADAWSELIARYEGRLLSYVGCRTSNRAAAEDVVQETFIGLLTSLPHYDPRQSLESYLFSIAAHKLTDHLRRTGRRPAIPLGASDTSGAWQPVDQAPRASTIARGRERNDLQEAALVQAIAEQIAHWRSREQWDRLMCLELLWVRGWTNKEVAGHLGMTEQIVANYKFETVARLRNSLRNQKLSADVFPELHESGAP